MSMENTSFETPEKSSESLVSRSLLSKVLDAESFWYTPTNTSWPECGAISRDDRSVLLESTYMTSDDLTEDTVALYHVDEKGHVEVVYRDRSIGGESLEHFKSRVAVVLDSRTTTPQTSES